MKTAAGIGDNCIDDYTNIGRRYPTGMLQHLLYFTIYREHVEPSLVYPFTYIK